MDLTTTTPAAGDRHANHPPPSDWREALGDLISARIALIRHESKTVVRQSVKNLSLIVASALALLFMWALLLAGSIAAIAMATGCPWYWITLIAALLHLAVAAICLKAAGSSSSAPAFPITRAEFQKDREWLNNLKSPAKSND